MVEIPIVSELSLKMSMCFPFLPDVHRFRAGVSQPVQRTGDLHQEPHGAIPWGELLRGLTAHVSPRPFPPLSLAGHPKNSAFAFCQ